jgi:hypothetical protein
MAEEREGRDARR